MTEEQKPENELVEEFKRLGENLKNAIEAAWESEERKEISQEVQEGLTKVSQAVEGAVKEVVEGETVQRLRGEVDEFTERVRSGEVRDKVRAELRAALEKINAELEKAAASWTGSEEEAPSEEETPTEEGDG
ncbi:MAG: hypothetical protein GTO14_24130 [Anaerolineales bacterium]|nr:hypothetical protein [Anaerolineales bacterium]